MFLQFTGQVPECWSFTVFTGLRSVPQTGSRPRPFGRDDGNISNPRGSRPGPVSSVGELSSGLRMVGSLRLRRRIRSAADLLVTGTPGRSESLVLAEFLSSGAVRDSESVFIPVVPVGFLHPFPCALCSSRGSGRIRPEGGRRPGPRGGPPREL